MKVKITLTLLLSVGFLVQLIAQCPVVTDIEATGLTCLNSDDGTVTITVTGGSLPYEYSIDGGMTYQSSNYFDNLLAGSYNGAIIDALNCVTNFPFTIAEPVAPLMMEVIFDNPICAYECNGSAYTSIPFGSGEQPFQYLWSDGSTLPSNIGLCAGTYSVTVTDAKGCTVSQTLTLVLPPPLEAVIDVVDQTCLGIDGSLMATVTSINQGPPIFGWSTGEYGYNGALADTISGLYAGVYDLTVTDQNGCVDVIEAEVNSEIALSMSTTPANCGQADGTATAMVTGGSSNPTFLWNNGQTTPTATGLAQGGYSVTVFDASLACETHRIVYVDEDIGCKVKISGSVINDDNNRDCIEDYTSYANKSRLVQLRSAGTLVASDIVDSQGYYEFVLDAGTYELELYLQNPDSLLCPSTPVIPVDATTDGQTYTNDFYVANKVYADLSVLLTSATARPGTKNYQTLYVCNNGNANTNGSVSYQHDPLLLNFDAGGTEDSYDPQTQTATWSYGFISKKQCRVINVSFDLPASTVLGTVLENMATVEPIQGDDKPYNNSSTRFVTVVNSYDPNDKQNLAGRNTYGGNIDPSIETYDYYIRFQNTGTAPAYNVVVKDEIEANLDLSTIRPIAASHDYSIDMEGTNTLVFTFDNIMLPDSNTNEPDSHGFVYFQINRQPNLPLNTEIKNDVAIYFDYNEPVLTNEVINVLAPPLTIPNQEDAGFSCGLFPNPTAQTAIITLDLEVAQKLDIQVFDVVGRALPNIAENTFFPSGPSSISLDVGSWVAGFYWLHVRGENGDVIMKLVVE